MKKLLTYFTLTAFIICFQPAKADIDQQNMVGTTLVGAGALTTYMAIAGGAAAVIGTGGVALAAVGVAILIGNNTNSSSTLSSEPISIRLNPNTPLITPSGWTDPNTPPSTASLTGQWCQNGTYCGNTILEAANNLETSLNTAATNGVVLTYLSHTQNTNSAQVTYSRTQNGSPISNISYQFLFNGACPTGYTLTSGACNLTNASAVIKPKKGVMEVKRVGNTFEIDPQLNPSDLLPTEVVNVETNKVTVTDSSGGKTITELKPDSTATVTKQTPQPDGTTRTDTVNLSTPDPTTGNVIVTGTSTNFVQGTGDLTGSELDLSSLNKEATQQAISNKLTDINNGQCGGEGQPSCNTKIDESDLDLSADTGLADLLNNIDNQNQEYTDLINQENAPTNDAGVSNNPLSNINTASCQPLTIPAFGLFTGVNLDPCPVANAALPLVDWMFKILAIIYAVYRFRSITSGVPE